MSSTKLLSQPLALAMIWLIGAAGAIGILLGSGLGLAGLIGITAGIGLTLITSFTAAQSPGGKALASLISVTTGALLVGALGLIVLSTGLEWALLTAIALLTTCVFLGFGASAAAVDSLDFSSTNRSSMLVILTILPLFIYGLVHIPSIIREFDETAGDDPWFELAMLTEPLTDHLFAPEPGVSALSVLLGLLIILYGSLIITIPRLTILRLLQRETQESVEAFLDTGKTWANRGILGLILLISIVGVAGHFGFVENESTFVYADELADASLLLQDIAAILPIRLIILSVLSLLWVALLISLIPSIPRLRHNRIIAELPTLSGGIIVVLAIHVGYQPLYERLIEPRLQERDPAAPLFGEEARLDAITLMDVMPFISPPLGRAVTALGVVVLLLSVFAVLLLVSLLEALEFISEGGDPGGIAGSALVGAGLVLGIDGVNVLLVGLLVLFGILVWDVTRYAQSVVAELGSTSTTVAPVLAHATGTLVLGLIFLLGIVIMQPRISALDPAEFATLVFALLVLGILFAFAALKLRATRLATNFN